MLTPTEIERALVVTAHPDDVDFGASGTIAGWVDAGVEVTYCVITDGDAGGFDPAVPRSEIPRIRRAEQVAAAAATGVQVGAATVVERVSVGGSELNGDVVALDGGIGFA